MSSSAYQLLLVSSFATISLVNFYEYYHFRKLNLSNDIIDRFFFQITLLSFFSIFVSPMTGVLSLIFVNIYQSFRAGGLLQGSSDFIFNLLGVLLFLKTIQAISEEAFLISLMASAFIAYVLPGLYKLKNLKLWHDTGFEIIGQHYGLDLNFNEIFRTRGLANFFIGFEILLPFLFLSEKLRLIGVFLAFLFHFANSYFLGLTRFFRSFALLLLWLACN